MQVRSLMVVATTGCNLRCEYCYMPARTAGRSSCPPPRRALEALLQRASADLSVTITGGEPLVALPRVRGIVSAVERARPAGSKIRWKLLTNGLLLDAETLAFLDAHGFAIRLSFDGVPSAQLLRGRGTFATLDALLDRLARRYHRLFRDRLEISMVLSPQSVRELAASVEYFLHKGVKEIMLNPAMGTPGWRLEQLEELDAAFARVAALALRHYESTCEVPLAIFRKTRRDAPEESSGWICAAPDPGTLALDVDGVAYGCVLATASYQPARVTSSSAVAALRVGRPDAPRFDVMLAELPERARASGAFEHPERRYSSYRRCSECEFLGRCRICPLAGAHLAQSGDRDRVPDFLCAFNMVTLAQRDRFPCQADGFDLLTGAVPFPSLNRIGRK